MKKFKGTSGLKMILIICITLLLKQNFMAGITTRNIKITGNAIVNGAIVNNQEDLYDYTLVTPPANLNFADKQINNRVILKYTGALKNYYASNWNINVALKIERFNSLGVALPVINTALNINYLTSGTYNDIAVYATTGGYRTRVTITGITKTGSIPALLPSDIHLESEIEVERYYTLLLNNPAVSINHAIVAPNNSTEIYWGFILGAEEYDLEFVHVSDYIVPAITNVSQVDFSNATRVSCINNFYKLNLAFDNGKIYYRVRGAGVDLATFDKRLESNWIYGATGIPIINFHQKSNWTYSGAYAEQGKSKEVTTYFDGSGRNRQSVALNNSDDIAIISETFYDFEGRSSVQSMPSPDNIYNNQLKFYTGFTLNNSNANYSKFDFDDGLAMCSTAGYEMGTGNGASKYYSPANSKLGNANTLNFFNAIPNALKYPNVRNVYNLEGQVIATSMPGIDHKITSGHENIFISATASQEKLDRLFGNEVGFAEHYKEEVSIDANGQITVAFKDLSGKVIATAMRGDKPLNLKDLNDPALTLTSDEPYMTGELTQQDLLTPNLQTGTGYIAVTDLLVTNAGPPNAPTNYDFTYNVSPQTFNDLCTNSAWPCKYILTISITDECGNLVNAIAPNAAYLNVPHAIDPILYPSGYSQNFTVHFPFNGKYKITKEIKLDQAAMAVYVAQYTAIVTNTANPNSCMPSYNTLVNIALGNIDNEGCETCQDYCVANTNDYFLNTPPNVIPPQNDPAWIAQYQLCTQENCDKDVPIVKSCNGLLAILKDNVSPGGQYFDHVYSPGTYGAITIANPTNFIDMLIALNPNFVADFNTFLTANNTCPALPPGPVNHAAFAANWSSCYKDFLVLFHPEYCRYLRCISLQPSDNYDYLIQGLNYNSAQTTNAAGVTCAPPCNEVFNLSASPTGISILQQDPFYSGIGSGFAASMANEILNCPSCVSSIGPPPGNVANCSVGAGGTMWNYADCMPVALIPASPTYLNDKYKNFISIYLSVKNKHKTNIPCSALMDNSTPPDLITDGYAPPVVVTTPNNYNTPVVNGMNIIDPDLNIILNNVMTNVTNSPPYLLPGNGPNTGPNDCYYEASSINLEDEFSGNDFCPYFQNNQNNGPYLINNPSSCYYVKYQVTNVPGYPGTISISNNINLSASMSVLTMITNIAADINSYVSIPDFTAAVDLSIPNFPQLVITAPNNLSSQLVVPNTPIKLNIIRAQGTNCQNVDNLCVNIPFDPAIKHCDEYNGPECLCTLISQLTDDYNAANPPFQVSLVQYITNQINLNYPCLITLDATGVVIDNSVTPAQVSYWMNNCTNNAGTPYPLDQDGEVAETMPQGYEIPNCLTCDEPCDQEATDVATQSAEEEFEENAAQQVENFIQAYTTKCLSNLNEKFEVKYTEKEYHYTLYYYDQAGNLVRTVPPAAVKRIAAATLYTGPNNSNKVHYVRTTQTYSIYTEHAINGQLSNSPPVLNPANSFVTNYKYNSYNLLVKQQTPDGGITNFWYDDLGRLRFSQNDKQLAVPCIGCPQPSYYSGRYSYNIYDGQDRIIEVGENDQVYSPTGFSPYFIFNIGVNDQTFPGNFGTEVTKTYYDAAIVGNFVNTIFTNSTQKELRKRIASVTFEELEDNNDNSYNNATHYSYDVHGNVKELVQDNPYLTGTGQVYKKLNYEYDLISDKINKIDYQNDQQDQFHHRYYYDAENRITSAYTSKDNVIWERDVRYFYYLHGLTARTELGDEKVQAMDYAHTLNGWMKLVNGNFIDDQKELGLDGNINPSFQYQTSQNNLHSNIARDAYGYSLDYFTNDYLTITAATANQLTGNINTSVAFNSTSGLFNGNIRAMTTALSDNTAPWKVLSKWFQYDQLNRIKTVTNFTQTANGNNLSALSATGDYSEFFRYDANGNILKVQRSGYTAPSVTPAMDNMTYNYNTGTNKLNYVVDAGDNANPNLYQDIKNQSINNYDYDQLGNLIKDNAEQVANISWSSYGKIKKITRTNTSTRPDIEYYYDAHGNRVIKVTKPRNGSGVMTQENWIYTYYVRDAAGNVMAVYDRNFDFINSGNYSDVVTLKEQHLYGADRLAINNRSEVLYSQSYAFAFYNPDGTLVGVSPPPPLPVPYLPVLFARNIGDKFFELNNHLGNVLTVISDKKIPVDVGANGTTDYYKAEVMRAVDYFVFGAPMPGRQYNNSNYRYSFNGKENDFESFDPGDGMQDYGMRIYNPSLGRFFSVDPITKDYPELTPYQFASNRPIDGIDQDGLEFLKVILEAGGKVAIKKIATRFVEKLIKDRIKAYATRSWGKQLAKDAVDVLGWYSNEAWWEYAIEFIPYGIGEGYVLARLTTMGDKLAEIERLAIWGKNISRFSDEFVTTSLKLIEKAVDNRDHLRKALFKAGKIAGDQIAHHLIPVKLAKNNEVVQAAIGAGFDFNGLINAKAVAYHKHNTGGHKKYTKYVESLINNWADAHKGFDPKEAKEFLENLTPQLDKYVDGLKKIK